MTINSITDISEVVKKRRKSLGLTQSECAAMCNVGNRFFSELENGKETLHIGKVINCLQILGINISLTNREDNE
ncbi:MAG: helix-turn-helix domain-containing protein [Treponema succinifaciens]|uniref:helix-turn-helix domain-containing protein n=1 Tax=Treponema succinifaciens TaxID=167 RepID=UPI002355A787|nr:helix-turn-helix domain-containing protein [Treponema succinifaciens]MCI6913402.1 helix-turn-helix domain-containing protein [Treponema succinifaciens]MDD6961350.1 helix-turn-helix domain-containing protein [Treponema succinifaciens]MDY2616498.1 helix-turn-helix domain-containing protein [Treponema succinifaciens]MDY5117309.1 helix-turn-helix domain-containing protein [Treponema succinifaciens]